MRQLLFEVKRNLKTLPRIYVKSSATKKIYGSFLANKPHDFEGWEKMDQVEKTELKQYMQNLSAISRYCGEKKLDELADHRLRLPLSLSNVLEEFSILDDAFDIYEPMISAIVKTLKITATKAEPAVKEKAHALLEKLELSIPKKLDHTQEIQSIFSTLVNVHNKSEKLHVESKRLFNKDKSFSPKTIENMGQGTMQPSKWLVACAIVVLLAENAAIFDQMLTTEDLYSLLAKPLLGSNAIDELNAIIEQYKLDKLKIKIRDYRS